MPKQFRQCGFCPINTRIDSETVIFAVNSKLRDTLGSGYHHVKFICENHFDRGDIRSHADSKRLRDGAIPVFLDNRNFPSDDSLEINDSPHLENEFVKDSVYDSRDLENDFVKDYELHDKDSLEPMTKSEFDGVKKVESLPSYIQPITIPMKAIHEVSKLNFMLGPTVLLNL